MDKHIMDNAPVEDTIIPDTAITALEIFTQIIKDKVAAYPVFGRSDTDLRELNEILTMSIKDMVINTKSCTDAISDEHIVEFVSYYNKIKSK